MGINTLLINASMEVETHFRQSRDAVFGDDSNHSEYRRPFEGKCPGMKPSGREQFDVVVIDLADWIGQRDDLEVVKATLPDWLTNDIAKGTSKSFVAILAPPQAFQGAHALLENRWPFKNKIVLIGDPNSQLKSTGKTISQSIFDFWKGLGASMGDGGGPSGPMDFLKR